MHDQHQSQEAIGKEIADKLLLFRDRYGDLENIKAGLNHAHFLICQKQVEEDGLKTEKTTEITINGIKHTVKGDRISYEQIAEMAHGLPVRVMSCVLSIHGGYMRSLFPGQDFVLMDGMRIEIMDTSNA